MVNARHGFWGCLASAAFLLLGAGVAYSAHAGYTNGPNPQGKPCINPPCCGCSGSGAGGSSGSGGASPATPGMPVYDVNPMLIGLVLQDTPLAYTPPRGPAIEFQLTYNQKDVDQPGAPAFGNVGPKWAFNWLEYVQDNPGSTGNQVMLYLPDGQGRNATGYSSASGAFARETQTGAILALVSTSPVTYERRLPDGGKEVFAASDGSTTYPRRVFLTQRVDAQGNAVTLAYDGRQRLTSITDAVGRTSTLEYADVTHPLLLTGVHDPFGRTAQLAYDSSGRLASVTDALGMTSSFTYANATRIGALTTPYGTTTFDYGESGYHYWLNITDANGHTSRWEFMNSAPGIPFSESRVPAGIPTFNSYINGRNTFYWDANAYAQAPGDYTKARIYHWEHQYIGGFSSTTSDALESVKYPDENRIWYAFPGGNPAGTSGSLNLPSVTARVLPDGTTQLATRQYNAQGNVTQDIDAAGLRTDTTYAANGVDPIQVSYAGPGGYQATETYTYNDQHLPLTHTDETGATTSYTYNAAGQRTSTTDALGHTTRYAYDGNGYLVAVTDANGRATTYTYDAIGRKSSETDPLGNTKTFAYDALNRVTRIIYWDGSYEQNTYDKLDRVAHRDRNGNATRYAYDAMRNLVAVTDPVGGVTRYAYYANNLMASQTDAAGGVTTWTRDLEGRVTAIQDPNGGVSTVAYDAANRRVSTTNALGQVTRYLAYDGKDRLTAIADANGVITAMTYHPRGWPTGRSVRAAADGSPSAGDATTVMTYGPSGDLVSVTEPDGVASVFIYDAAHRLTDIGDAMGNSIGYTLDAVGNRIAEKTYAAGGALTRTVTRSFDARNAVASETDGEGNTTTFGYDADGNRSDVRDPLGVRSRSTFDPENRLTTSVQNYGGRDLATRNTQTAYRYDAANHLTAVIDPDGLVTGYQVDAMGRVTQLTSPDTARTTYTYDVAGNRTSQTDARGITSRHGYDALNRMTSIGYPTASLDVAYHYDEPDAATGCNGSYPVGHLTRMLDSSGSTTWCYDPRGNVTRKQQVIAGTTYTTTYAYNLANRLMAVTYPDGASVTYSRDADGRVAAVTTSTAAGVSTATVSGIDYLPFGPATRYAFGSGQAQAKTFDRAYRSTGVASDALYLQYTLDAAGNPITLKDDPRQHQPIERYGYDPLDRLQRVDDAAGLPWQVYTYDHTGDRLTKSTAWRGTDFYQYQLGTHRLLATLGPDLTARAMDRNGNTSAIASLGGLAGFGYDDRNRLALVQQNLRTVMRYTLNGRGERVRKELGGKQAIGRDFIYDESGRLLAEYTDRNGGGKDYVWADDTLVAMYATDSQGTARLQYVYTDGLGTPRAMTGAGGKITLWTWPIRQNPFGERAAIGMPDALNLRFPGQYYDDETGLHYNYFRDYEPGVGRYVQSDPIGLVGGIGTYVYVGGDPLATADATGLRACSGRWRQVGSVMLNGPGAIFALAQNLVCRCVWLCTPCSGSYMWSGDPTDPSLPRTTGVPVGMGGGASMDPQPGRNGHKVEPSPSQCACAPPG
jgi:RHS repeat-associated protein